MPDAKGRTAYFAYKSLGTVLQLFPRSAASLIATAAGLTMSEVWRDRRPIVKANLRRVLGDGVSERELDRAVREAFDSYARYWVESARLTGMRPRDVQRRFSIEGFEPLEEALVERRGAIVALPHIGSWEVGGLWMTLRGYPMTTVVEPVEPPELFEWFKEQRSALGLRVLPLANESTGALLETLRLGGLVGLVADRDLVGTGVEVVFFGEKTKLPGGPAVLSLRTGVAIFPTAIYQRPNGYYHAVVRPPLECARSGRLKDDVVAITSTLAQEFESLIRAAPTQWHMFQPNWPSDETS